MSRFSTFFYGYCLLFCDHFERKVAKTCFPIAKFDFLTFFFKIQIFGKITLHLVLSHV
jgi:hypothetical protein